MSLLNHISVFDLFKIGIGPSSSHTVGPMRAAYRFLEAIPSSQLSQAESITVHLYGSLALTGEGHATDQAIVLGLSGELPDQVDPANIQTQLKKIKAEQRLLLLGKHSIVFDWQKHIEWHKDKTLPEHPNGMRFVLRLNSGKEHAQIFYSIGGGFIKTEGDDQELVNNDTQKNIPYAFANMADLLHLGDTQQLSIAQMMHANELCNYSQEQLQEGIQKIVKVMLASIERGLNTNGVLPGTLRVERRAPHLWQKHQDSQNRLPHQAIDHVSIYAIAVNEENAAGSQVVTAPTNGAAGIVPAILRYYLEDCKATHNKPIDQCLLDFFLTATAIGSLCKRNASISGAEMGCQGEVGVAAAMAAGALTAVLGGSNAQIENAAEIAIEHHLGMTCDPVAGLVQIPCIERNGIGAIKVLTATSLALKGTGKHRVSLDQAIATMRQTGIDMKTQYKETSLGGLALKVLSVNLADC